MVLNSPENFSNFGYSQCESPDDKTPQHLSSVNRPDDITPKHLSSVVSHMTLDISELSRIFNGVFIAGVDNDSLKKVYESSIGILTEFSMAPQF
jgi:hypothetical protein